MIDNEVITPEFRVAKMRFIAEKYFPNSYLKIETGELDPLRLAIMIGGPIESEHVSVGDGIVTMHLPDRDDSYAMLEHSEFWSPDGNGWLIMATQPLDWPAYTDAELEWLWPHRHD